jgi:hypothetical protein
MSDGAVGVSKIRDIRVIRGPAAINEVTTERINSNE